MQTHSISDRKGSAQWPNAEATGNNAENTSQVLRKEIQNDLSVRKGGHFECRLSNSMSPFQPVYWQDFNPRKQSKTATGIFVKYTQMTLKAPAFWTVALRYLPASALSFRSTCAETSSGANFLLITGQSIFTFWPSKSTLYDTSFSSSSTSLGWRPTKRFTE